MQAPGELPMADTTPTSELPSKPSRRSRQRKRGFAENVEVAVSSTSPTEVDVGLRLRELRNERGLSVRALANASRLNANTLSLIENGKTSPSVSTLQQLANALKTPIAAFFQTDIPKNKISFLKAGQRPRAAFAHGNFEDLGAGLTLQGGLPLLVTLEPKANSGPTPIVHTGHEFVFCLEGCLSYTIEDHDYQLDPGDSLLFEAYLPHYWFNTGETPSQSLLVLCPADESDHPTERHFIPE
jgi:transcriptional regulator with XRE-family HTH domain